MKWHTVKFEWLFKEPQRNGLYKTKEFHGTGVKIVNMGELFAFRFVGSQDMKRIQVTDEEFDRFNLINGDLLFARRSLIESGAGKCVIVERITEPTVFESSLIRIRLDKTKSFPRFYFYYFSAPPGRPLVEAIITGAAQKGIRGSELAKIYIDLPPLPAQRKIAAILSAYDDLIENNLRRIKILEEMAQNLYREWFVKFRFPGHEHTRFVDSPLGRIPEEWEVKSIGDVAINFDKLRKPLSKMVRAQRQGIYPYYGAAKIFDYIDDFIFDGIYLLMAEDGSVITPDRKPVLQYVTGKFWANNHTHILKGIGNVSTEFLYLALSELDVTGYITGAAQPKITQTNLNRIPVIVADDLHLKRFNKFVASIFQQKVNLKMKNATLRHTRDLLLPKLISGEVDVSELDIYVPEEVNP